MGKNNICGGIMKKNKVSLLMGVEIGTWSQVEAFIADLKMKTWTEQKVAEIDLS